MAYERYCVNCIHFESPKHRRCAREVKVSLVTGIAEVSPKYCQEERNNEAACGPEGRFFKPKE